MTFLLPKLELIRDPAWLEHIRLNKACVCTGERSNDRETVDPAHLGAYRGMKRSDDEVIPLIHRLHALGHNQGEMTILRQHLPDYMLREFARAWARQEYKKWKGR